MADLELEHIQGFITFGYGHLEYAAYLFLHFDDAAQGRGWLARITPMVTPARSEKGTQAVHVALTFAGLGQLGLPEDGLGTFPRQFQEGMPAPDRARILGDEGSESPDNWQFGGSSNEEVHALLILFAHTPEAWAALCSRQEEIMAQPGGARVVWREDSERPANNQEQFGFRDGISQPAIDGSPVRAKEGQTVMPPGEFILGYENAYGQFPFAPTVAPETDMAGLLTPDPNDVGRLSLGRNGTYLVMRKLQQNVGAFWNYFREQAAGENEEMNRLAAKCVGRWRSGASLTLSPDHDDGQVENAFSYRKLDPDGEGCPLGAHVRRTNPRDMLAPDTSDDSVTINHHRILRRGRPYGPCLIHPETAPEDDSDRGLLFLAINANIRRQFEFVQQTWVNTPNFAGLYTDRDPLLGDSANTTVTIPSGPIRTRLTGLPQFVTMRGGGYFFLPSIPALRYLSGLE